jgi:hypothetical protein
MLFNEEYFHVEVVLPKQGGALTWKSLNCTRTLEGNLELSIKVTSSCLLFWKNK